MGATAIIPARLGSTRFPEKVLADATGWPLVRHVHERARLAASVSRVVVATDHPRVMDAVRAFGGECVMTSAEHPNGSSRLAEAAGLLGLGPDDVIVNVQGDEPELDPGLIDAAVGALRATPGADAATIASPIDRAADAADANVVKVVLRADHSALYFSRAPIPHYRDGDGTGWLRHVGLYAYRTAYLRRYVRMPETPLERAEKLEQLRILENGGVIAVAVRPSSHAGVDTPEQYAAFVARWKRRA
ncbi:MAG: 3-deoxy-manno-octulosonate cytidylyltransferase [Phycisphaerales bacterium]|nr:3-deoxy-manno-octulosonate cytidylyltransferase [Phycisphaerales bacterium]